jgi:hypothetical protein
MSFRVSIAQQPLVWQDAAANRAHFAKVLAPLAGATDLVVLPEMFTTGFTMKPQDQAEAADGPTRVWLQEQAVALDAAVGGSVAVQENGRFLQPLHDRDARRPHVLVRQAAPVPHGRRTSSLQRRGARTHRRMARRAAVPAGVPTTCVSPSGAGAGPSSNTTSSCMRPTGRRPRRFAWSTLLRARAIEKPGVLHRREPRRGRRRPASRTPATAWCSISWAGRCSSSATTRR